MRPRITVLEGMSLVLAAALGLAALQSAAAVWVALIGWTVLSWLCAAVVGSVVRTGRARAFWLGFAVFGWTYLLLIHVSLVSTTFSEQIGSSLRGAIDAMVEAPVQTPGLNPAAQRALYQEAARYRIRVRIISDYYLNLMFGGAGGLLALRFASQEEAERVPEVPKSG